MLSSEVRRHVTADAAGSLLSERSLAKAFEAILYHCNSLTRIRHVPSPVVAVDCPSSWPSRPRLPRPRCTADDETAVEEIRVYATPVRARSDEVAQPVEILSGEALARQLGANLGDTVARLPGIHSSFFGPAVGRPIIRGLGDARVKILQDGVGVLDASSSSADHAVAVEPFLADQIEILKGPATVLYGSGALGGVVNTVTGRLPEQAREDGYAAGGIARGRR